VAGDDPGELPDVHLDEATSFERFQHDSQDSRVGAVA
jgi:hypothetical protein